MNKEEIITSIKKYKYFILLGVLAIFYVLIVSPLISKWKNMNKQINHLQSELSKDLPYLKKEKRVNGLYNALLNMMDFNVKEKDPEVLKTELYHKLDKVARRYNVVIKNYTPVIKEDRYRRDSRRSSRSSRSRSRRSRSRRSRSRREYSIIIRLNLVSTLFDFIKFAYYIENSPYLMQIRQVNFSPVKDNKLRVNLEIKKIVL